MPRASDGVIPAQHYHALGVPVLLPELPPALLLLWENFLQQQHYGAATGMDGLLLAGLGVTWLHLQEEGKDD